MKEIATIRSTDGVNVRADASPHSRIIDKVGDGEEFEILGKEPRGKVLWLTIRTKDGRTGHIAAEYTAIRIVPDPKMPPPADQHYDNAPLNDNGHDDDFPPLEPMPIIWQIAIPVIAGLVFLVALILLVFAS
jgi:hypothetical protein